MLLGMLRVWLGVESSLVNGWDLEWSKDNAKRYYKSRKRGATNLQLGKYRGADDFDKAMGNKYKWHGKWYVNVWYPEREWLFNSKAEAVKFADNFMRKN